MEPVLFICLGLVVVSIFLTWLSFRQAAASARAAGEARKEVEKLRAEVKALGGRVQSLESQAKDRSSDVLGLVDAVSGFRDRGLLPSLGLIAYRLFRSYSGRGRGAKELPAKVKP
jgi:hypothetical protein